MTDSERSGSSLLWKLVILAALVGVAYLIVTALGEDSGALQTYDGFS